LDEHIYRLAKIPHEEHEGIESKHQRTGGAVSGFSMKG
jgi:hypothetical protein